MRFYPLNSDNNPESQHIVDRGLETSHTVFSLSWSHLGLEVEGYCLRLGLRVTDTQSQRDTRRAV